MRSTRVPSPSMIRLSFSTILFFFLANHILAQYRDAGAWTAFAAEYKLRKSTELSIAPELRFHDNFSRINNAFLDVGLQEKLNDYLQVNLTYRAGYRDPFEIQIWRQRIQTGFALKRDISNWTFGVASRFQWAFVAVDDGDPDFVTTWRNKGLIKFNGVKKWEFTGTFEVFHAQNDEQSLAWTDWRSTIQAEYKINKRNFISFGYLVQRNLTSRVPEEDYVILASYKYILKKRKTNETETGLEKE